MYIGIGKYSQRRKKMLQKVYVIHTNYFNVLKVDLHETNYFEDEEWRTYREVPQTDNLKNKTADDTAGLTKACYR